MSNPVFPNTFLIGIQKAGTTTLDDWLAQHPQIYCYESLKDIHLFERFKNLQEIKERLGKEPEMYKGQPVVLQSAVNYIFYPHLLKQIKETSPDAKLMVILRNPVDRAISSFFYFKKYHREKRSMQDALIYHPSKENFAFSKDNSDFTYIEHGLYAHQLKHVYNYFNHDRLLIMDFDDLKSNTSTLLKNIFSFLGVDENFQPDLSPKNVTGNVKSAAFQEKLLNRSPMRKWVVDKIIDPVFPVGKRRMLKKYLFEWNTDKSKKPVEQQQESKEEIARIKKQLAPHFMDDVKELDQMLGTSYYTKWIEPFL